MYRDTSPPVSSVNPSDTIKLIIPASEMNFYKPKSDGELWCFFAPEITDNLKNVDIPRWSKCIFDTTAAPNFYFVEILPRGGVAGGLYLDKMYHLHIQFRHDRDSIFKMPTSPKRLEFLWELENKLTGTIKKDT